MKWHGKDWKRKTYWLTNSPVIRDRVSTGTKETVESATKKGLIQQLIKDRRIRHETDKWISFVQDEEDWQDDTIQAWDDVSGQALDPQEVARARQEEIEEYRKHGVYTKVDIQECWDETGKAPVKTKWVDTNKGDKINREYRSRLVAKEVKRITGMIYSRRRHRWKL